MLHSFIELWTSSVFLLFPPFYFAYCAYTFIFPWTLDAIVLFVRNMVFFELFLCYFVRLSMLFYSPTFFSLSFTLPRKDNMRAIDLMT